MNIPWGKKTGEGHGMFSEEIGMTNKQTDTQSSISWSERFKGKLLDTTFIYQIGKRLQKW